MKLIELIAQNLNDEDKKLAILLDFNKTDDEIISTLVSKKYVSFEIVKDYDDKEN